MLKKIEELPANVLGFRAEGEVTREDYENVLIPLLERERAAGRRVRFLYQFGSEFKGLTAGALWDDFRVGLKYLRLFERCAVVSDADWIRTATRVVGGLLPCPTQVFKNDELKKAIDWLASETAGSNLKFELKEKGVLVLYPEGPLRREDFDRLAGVVDPWIEAHQELSGVVLQIRKFPGWENVGSFIEHFDFVKAHHRKIRRVAVVMDGTLPALTARLVSHFVEAQIKDFPYDQADRAIDWAGSKSK